MSSAVLCNKTTSYMDIEYSLFFNLQDVYKLMKKMKTKLGVIIIFSSIRGRIIGVMYKSAV